MFCRKEKSLGPAGNWTPDHPPHTTLTRQSHLKAIMKYFFTKIILHTHTHIHTHTKYVQGIQYRSHYDLHILFPKPFQYGEFLKKI